MADEKTNEDAGAEAAAAPKAESSGKSPIVTVLLLINAIAMIVVAYFQWTSMEREASRPDVQDIVKAEMKKFGDEGGGDESVALEKEVKRPEGFLFPLEGFTANLAQGDGPRRYVRLNAVLKFSNDSKEAEFKARQPQIRDTIIAILNSKRPEDLLKKEGKAYLKEEIKAAINSFLVDGHIQDIYYVGFQIN